MKITIVGYSGSGKSTLASFIGTYFSIPYTHLDKVCLGANFTPKQTEVIERDFTEVLSRDSWVIDGNYTSKFFDTRLSDSDYIIFMNFNRINTLFRVVKRYIKYHGKVRESVSENCKENLSFEFVKWVLFGGRTKKKRSRFKKIKEDYPDKYIEIKNQRQLTRFKKNINKYLKV